MDRDDAPSAAPILSPHAILMRQSINTILVLSTESSRKYACHHTMKINLSGSMK